MFDAHAHIGDCKIDNVFICTSSPSQYTVAKAFRYRAAGYLPESCEAMDETAMAEAAEEGFHIGEVGLDKRFPEMDKQEENLRKALEIARDFDRIAVIHIVREYERTRKIIEEMNIKRFLVHGWTGSYEEALLFIKLGAVISISPKAARAKSFPKLLTLPFVTETDMKTGLDEEDALRRWNEHLSQLTGFDTAERTEKIMKEMLCE